LSSIYFNNFVLLLRMTRATFRNRGLCMLQDFYSTPRLSFGNPPSSLFFSAPGPARKTPPMAPAHNLLPMFRKIFQFDIG